MLLEIENIGLIDKAAIRLDGLTVIGGENDTGKSTAGKLMFAITKALTRYSEDFAISKEATILGLAQNLYFNIRRVHPNIDERYREEFSPKQFEFALAAFLNKHQLTLFDSNEVFEVKDFFQRKIELIKNDELIKENQKKAFIKILKEIQKEIETKDDRNELIQKALNRALISEFYFEISPNDQLSKITISDNDVLLLKIEIQNNEIKKIEVGDLFNFNDVTFIETPLILQLSELINFSNTLFEVASEDKAIRLGSLNRPTVALRFKDLMNKLQKSNQIDALYHNAVIDFWKFVSKTIDGTFQYDSKNRDFIFKRKDNKQVLEIKSVNTASGIKSFGIIQLLLQAGFIDERTLLIIDEPETHLHPKWQVEYAKLIVELVKNNYNFLLTSHSPYMIQALRVLSEKEEINDRTAFYLAERIDGKSSFEDVSADLGKLFRKLAEPLNELIWQQKQV